MTRAFRVFVVLLLVVGCAGDPQAGRILQGVLDAVATPAAGEDRVAAGLREALRVGTERAVERTSRPGGFLDAPRLRIPLPDALDTPARGLRAIGLGHHVDELEVTMNRAAERAAAEATPVFWDAVRGLTIADAQQILNGGDTAATDLFRDRTSSALTRRFRPEVQGAMRQVGLYRDYEQLLAAWERVPLADKPSLDLTEFVTDRTVAGLFTVLGEEERRIRRDPVARTTELLREVFGG